MSIKHIRAASLNEALSTLETSALSNEEMVFRGHSQSHYRLCSTLSRYSSIPHASWDSDIDDMLSHFLTNIRSIGELPTGIAEDRRARLEYGRHYGVPSPLIDFSLSPYVALFFAFTGVRANPKEESVVYILNVDSLALEWAKRITTLNGDRLNEERERFRYERKPLFENGYPGGILKYIRLPASWNKRMQRQMGVFIYDSLDYASLGQRDLEDFIEQLKETPDSLSGSASPMLTKLFVSQSSAGEVFSRLELMGINATRLYDDYSGAATDIYNTYNYNRKTGYAWDLRMSPPVR